MMRNKCKVLSLTLIASMLLSPCIVDVQAKKAKKTKKATVSVKKLSLKVGQSKKISIKKKNKKAKYTFSSSKKAVATVSKKGKVKAVKQGTAKITVKEKYKKKTRKVGTVVVKVTKKKTPEKTSGTLPTPNNTQSSVNPTATPTATATATATASAEPTSTATTKPTKTPGATVPPEYNPPADYTKKKTDVTYGTKKSITYDSKTTGVERKAYVVLPNGYSEEKTYPVVYLLHGIGGDQNEWFQGKPMEIVGNLIAAGEADEMIMVFPNIRARADDKASYDLSVEHFQAFDNFINDLRDDLMPYIESNYPVKKGRENTAVCGLSMGGRETLNIGLKMPDKFKYIGAFEPAIGVLPYDLEKGLFTEDTMTLPDEYKNNTFIMIVKGQSDGTVGENPLLYHRALEKNGVPHIYYDMPGGHDFKVWNNGLYNFAKRIFSKSTIK